MFNMEYQDPNIEQQDTPDVVTPPVEDTQVPQDNSDLLASNKGAIPSLKNPAPTGNTPVTVNNAPDPSMYLKSQTIKNGTTQSNSNSDPYGAISQMLDASKPQYNQAREDSIRSIAKTNAVGDMFRSLIDVGGMVGGANVGQRKDTSLNSLNAYYKNISDYNRSLGDWRKQYYDLLKTKAVAEGKSESEAETWAMRGANDLAKIKAAKDADAIQQEANRLLNAKIARDKLNAAAHAQKNKTTKPDKPYFNIPDGSYNKGFDKGQSQTLWTNYQEMFPNGHDKNMYTKLYDVNSKIYPAVQQQLMNDAYNKNHNYKRAVDSQYNVWNSGRQPVQKSNDPNSFDNINNDPSIAPAPDGSNIQQPSLKPKRVIYKPGMKFN